MLWHWFLFLLTFFMTDLSMSLTVNISPWRIILENHYIINRWPKDKRSFIPILTFLNQSYLLLLLLLSHFSRVRLCATPQTAAHQASLSLGSSRQEHWSGVPLPSSMCESEKWGEESRWRRNRTGKPLSLLQIHLKNNWKVNKIYKTTSNR